MLLLEFPSRLLTRDGITVLLLHRVGERSGARLPANEAMKVSEGRLEAFVRGARHRGFSFISLDEAHRQVVSGQVRARQIVVTFDDGYRDNLVLGQPLLARLGVPFTVYVTTSFADRTARLWWYALEDAVLESPRLELADGARHEWATLKEAQALFLALRQRILVEGAADPATFVEQLLGRHIGYRRYVDELALSWDEVRTLAASEGTCIGAHTVNHRPLAKLSDDEARWEMAESRARLEAQIGRPVLHLAYPFGGAEEAGAREFRLAAHCGFHTATTTRVGLVRWQHRDHLHALPRVVLDDDFSLPRMGWQILRRSRGGHRLVTA